MNSERTRRALLAGAIAGFAASAARAPLAASVFDGPSIDSMRALWTRAAALMSIAVGFGAAPRFFGERNALAAAMSGAVAGFAAHALFLANSWRLAQPLQLGALLIAAAFAIAVLGHEPAGNASELSRAPRRSLRGPGLACAGLGLALALECVARSLREFGSSRDEESVYALSLIVCAAVGTVAFGFLARGERAVRALGLALAAAVAACTLSLALLEPLASRAGLDAFLRTALLGAVRLDLSRRAMFDADGLIAARAFVAPGFALGVALAALRSERDFRGLFVGLALGTLLASSFASSQGPTNAEELAHFLARRELGALAIAAVGALLVLGAELKRARWTAAVLAALAIAAWLAPLSFSALAAPALASPWERADVRVDSCFDAAVGRVTLTARADGTPQVELDRRRLTPDARGLAAERAAFAATWRDLQLAHQGVRVLLVGVSTPERESELRRLGAARIDRTAAWWEALPTLEAALFKGVERAPGEILSPGDAASHLGEPDAKRWDLVLVLPTEGEAFDLPALEPRSAIAIAIWQRADGGLEDRDCGARNAWRSDVALAADGLDQPLFGFLSASEKLAPSADQERITFGAARARPTPWRALWTRGFQREFDESAAAFERLEDGARGGVNEQLARALRLHYAAQEYSSPFESPAQQIELSRPALDLLRELALEREPAPFLRGAWEWLAQILVQKREVELLFSHVAPIAGAHAIWPALERALASAEAESLDPRAAAEHWSRAISAEPYRLESYAPCAEWWLAAGDAAKAAEVLDAALALQPARRDWERLRAIAWVRGGATQGHSEVARLVALDPNDRELAAYLGDGPWPPYEPALQR